VIARNLITQLAHHPSARGRLFNVNIPLLATQRACAVRVVPMGTNCYGNQYIRRQDPKGRDYYWAAGDPPPPPTDRDTDLSALRSGFVTVTPLQFDLTEPRLMEDMRGWQLDL
jgi:5'-nucleotidase